jgi:hypothetical protein
MNTNSILMYESRKASSNIWVLFLFLGWSHGSLGKMGLQFLFYITLGGFGVWTIIRLFTLNSAIKKYNRKIANQVGLSQEDMIALDLI